MNSYFLQHKIKTLSNLWSDPFEHQGFRLSQWNFTFAEGPIGQAWIAEATVKAANGVDAINDFRRRLIPLTDRIALASQCYCVAELEPFLVHKRNNNAKNILFLRYTRERDGVPLHFDQEEKDTLFALEKYPIKGDVFRYLREAINATTFYTRLAMLMAALEAAAGQQEQNGRKETHKKYIKDEILQDENLFNRLYAYGEGVRNQLFHGADINFKADSASDVNLPDLLYAKLIAYFNRKHGGQINTGVIGAPRNFVGNYEGSNLWLQPKGDLRPDFNLRELIQLHEQNGSNAASDLWKKFELTNMPADY